MMQQTQYSIIDIISICRNNAVLFQEDFELAKNILELKMSVSSYCGCTAIVKILVDCYFYNKKKSMKVK